MTKTITIEENFLEHLLACLANQKYTGDFNADAIEGGEDEYQKINAENQEVIDKAYSDGWDLLLANSPDEEDTAAETPEEAEQTP